MTVDTTVQEKAVAYPTDSKLLNRSRERLVKMCRRHGVKLRQSYARTGPKAVLKASRYAHARQMKRMKRELKRLRTIFWAGFGISRMQMPMVAQAVLLGG